MQKKVTIYDANNWFRRRLETSQGIGFSPVRQARDLLMLDQFPVVVWDGPGAKKKRTELYPDYKAKRVQAEDATYISFKALQEALVHAGVVQIIVPEYEADDVIATLVKRNYFDGHSIFIESNDKDFLQLGVPTASEGTLPCEAKWVRLYKTLVGDPSDNIPGLKGFGPKKWEALSEEDREVIEAWLLSCADFEDLPESFTDKHAIDFDLLRTFYSIVGFYDVPAELINRYSTFNPRDIPKSNAILEEHYQ